MTFSCIFWASLSFGHEQVQLIDWSEIKEEIKEVLNSCQTKPFCYEENEG